MKFVVDRTSTSWKQEKKPCDNARREACVSSWMKNGEKHSLKGERWIIELNSLDDLLAFAEEHGEVVLGVGFYEHPSIEIYDDYRE